jgi:hypothetical protein
MRARYLTRRRATRTSIMPGVCATRAIFASPRQGARGIHETARRVVNLCEFAIPCLLPPAGRQVLLEIVNSVAEQERRGVSVGRRFLTNVIIINPYITPDTARIHAALRRCAGIFISRSGTCQISNSLSRKGGREGTIDLWSISHVG